jgi:NAD-dependent dihydropyrimidine dehydrogenase PreA subunit
MLRNVLTADFAQKLAAHPLLTLQVSKMRKLSIILLFTVSILISGCDPSFDYNITVDETKCLGYSCRICEKVCTFDAIRLSGPNGIPVIDPNKCTSCGDCVNACPEQALTGGK